MGVGRRGTAAGARDDAPPRARAAPGGCAGLAPAVRRHHAAVPDGRHGSWAFPPRGPSRPRHRRRPRRGADGPRRWGNIQRLGAGARYRFSGTSTTGLAARVLLDGWSTRPEGDKRVSITGQQDFTGAADLLYSWTTSRGTDGVCLLVGTRHPPAQPLGGLPPAVANLGLPWRRFCWIRPDPRVSARDGLPPERIRLGHRHAPVRRGSRLRGLSAARRAGGPSPARPRALPWHIVLVGWVAQTAGSDGSRPERLPGRELDAGVSASSVSVGRRGDWGARA